MTAQWSPLETSRHQDHVIAHVIGASALGYFVHEEAVHLLLDIGFFWTIYVDGEMALVLQSLAIKDLALDERESSELLADVQSLHSGELTPFGLKQLSQAPSGCLIKEVEIYTQDERRRILIKGEDASLTINTSLQTAEISVEPMDAPTDRS